MKKKRHDMSRYLSLTRTSFTLGFETVIVGQVHTFQMILSQTVGTLISTASRAYDDF